MSTPQDPNRRPSLGEEELRQRHWWNSLARWAGGWWVLLPFTASLLAIAAVLEALPLPSALQAPAGARTPIIQLGGGPMPTPQPKDLQSFAIAPTPVPTISPVKPMVRDEGVRPVRNPRTADPEPTTDRFIVVDGDSGTILYQRNAFEPVAPASLTKIMTALLVIEEGNLNDRVKVDVDAASFPGSAVMGLSINTEVTLRDLLYGLLLASGNDAAVAIARHMTGGNGPAFMAKMNEKAAWLGLGTTHFENPHGFDDQNHYSSPADMVALARYAWQYPQFRQVVGTKSYEVKGPFSSYVIDNVNGILRAYPYADGIKTGDTPQAGKCSVTTAVKDGHRVFVAFMQSQAGAVPDGILLLDWAFNSHSWGASARPPNP